MLHGIGHRPTHFAGRRRLGATLFASPTCYCISISPAAAEVCDKVWDAAPAGFGFAFILAVFGAIPAAAFGRLWPSYVASGLLALLASTWIWDFAAGENVAVSAWAEGCEPSSSFSFLGCAIATLLLARWARRVYGA